MPGSVLWSGLWRPPATVKSVNGPLASCLTDEATSGEFVLCQQLTQIHGKSSEWTQAAQTLLSGEEDIDMTLKHETVHHCSHCTELNLTNYAQMDLQISLCFIRVA